MNCQSYIAHILTARLTDAECTAFRARRIRYQVFAEYRSAASHTCVYFDPWNQDTGQQMVTERREQGLCRWGEWFSARSGSITMPRRRIRHGNRLRVSVHKALSNGFVAPPSCTLAGAHRQTDRAGR